MLRADFRFLYSVVSYSIMPTFARRMRRGRGRQSFGRRVQSVLNRNLETKKYAQSVFNGVWGTTAQQFDFQAMIQGIGQNQRIGGEIRIKSLQLQFTVQNLLAGPANCRIVIFAVKADPEMSAVYPPIPIATWFDPVDTNKYTVLMDRMFQLGGTTAPSMPETRAFMFKRRYAGAGHLVRWAAAPATQIVGGIFCYLVGLDATDSQRVTLNALTTYKDA